MRISGHWILFVVAITFGILGAYSYILYLDSSFCVPEKSVKEEVSLERNNAASIFLQDSNIAKKLLKNKDHNVKFKNQLDIKKEAGQDSSETARHWKKNFFCEAKLTDVAIALFTYCLFIVGWFQAHYLKRQLKATEIAANAADLSAKAAIGVALPILRAIPVDLISVDEPIPANEPYGGIGNDGVPTPYSAVGLFQFKNHGKSPAFPAMFKAGWKVASKLPTVPTYDYLVNINHAKVIKPEEGFMVDFHCGIALTMEEIAAIKNETSWLWLYGVLSYRDFLDNSREAKFCWRWANRDIVGGVFFFFDSDGEPPEAYIR